VRKRGSGFVITTQAIEKLARVTIEALAGKVCGAKSGQRSVAHHRILGAEDEDLILR
jgi:hypothetical protein